MNKKMIAAILACAMAVGATIGGTIAWLTDTTDEVVNTFTVGNIEIELTESDATKEGDINKKNYDFVPGDTLLKDPTVTVKSESEDCWLFVKVTVANNSCEDTTVKPKVTADPVLTWATAEGWKQYTEYTDITKNGIYYFYRQVTKNDLKETVNGVEKAKDAVYQILNCQDSNNSEHEKCTGCVKVSTDVTKGMVTAMGKDGSSKPTLTFDAAAVQSKNIADVKTAFAETGWKTSGN